MLVKLHKNDTEVNGDDKDEAIESDFAEGILVRNRRLLA